MDMATDESHLDIHFCVEGGLDIKSHNHGVNFSTPSNQRSFFKGGNNRILLKFPAHTKCTSLTIATVPEFLESFQKPRADFDEYALDKKNSHCPIRGAATPEMLTIIHQIINNPHKGLTQKIFLEGKTFELIALHLAQTEMEKKQKKLPNGLQEYDIGRIYKAEKVLLKDIQNPPSLLNLARQVGLNDYKLKIGFRYVFGNTVFGHLQAHRMEIARRLLNKKDVNILEISNEVGYTNSSHFAATFRKRFGLNPSDFRVK